MVASGGSMLDDFISLPELRCLTQQKTKPLALDPTGCWDYLIPPIGSLPVPFISLALVRNGSGMFIYEWRIHLTSSLLAFCCFFFFFYNLSRIERIELSRSRWLDICISFPSLNKQRFPNQNLYSKEMDLALRLF